MIPVAPVHPLSPTTNWKLVHVFSVPRRINLSDESFHEGEDAGASQEQEGYERSTQSVFDLAGYHEDTKARSLKRKTTELRDVKRFFRNYCESGKIIPSDNHIGN